jgi:hypothetical protein
VSTEFYWTAVVLTTIVSASRLTRLATWDEFPPAKWLRYKYADATDGTGWQLLAFCGYCASFWITGLVVLWGWLSGVYGPDPFGGTSDADYAVWWIVNGVLAASYLAAILMAHDGDDPDDEDKN